jgi:hypothetical protein
MLNLVTQKKGVNLARPLLLIIQLDPRFSHMEAFDTNLLKGNHPTKKNLKFLSLQGEFFRDKSSIQLAQNQSIQILERKEYSQTKPRFYLVLKVGNSENYMSSLYPSKRQKIFYADYLATKYELDFTESERVKIRVRGVH